MRAAWLLLLPVLLFTAACVAAPSTPLAARTPTPTLSARHTPTPLPPTRTPTDRPPSPTPTAIHTHTLTLWTTTPTATPTQPLPAVATPDPAAALALVTPPPAALFQALEQAALLNQQAYQETAPPPGLARARVEDAAALDRLVAADAARYFPGGVPGAGDFIAGRPVTAVPNYLGPGLQRVLRDAVLDRLNRQPTRLQPGFELRFEGFTLIGTPAELDGDPGAEWLVAVAYAGYGVRDWLPVNVEPTGRYALLPHDWPVAGAEARVDAVPGYDLTGDGQADVLLVTRWHYRTQEFGAANLYAWDGARLALVGTVAFEPNARYLLGDFDGDTRTDLRVITPVAERFGCAWEKADLYRWPVGALTHTPLPRQRPTTAGCALAAALTSRDPQEIVSQLEFARRAFTSATATDRRAWTELRLAAAYAALGRDTEAAAALEAAFRLPGQGAVTDLVRAAIQQHGLEPLPVCAALYRAAQRRGPDQPFGSDLDPDLQVTWPNFSGEVGPWPDFVCPLRDLVAHRLAVLHPPSLALPAPGLQAVGFDLQADHWFNLDPDPALEWLGVLRLPAPVLVRADSVGGVWNFQVLADFDSPLTDVQLARLEPSLGAAPAGLLLARYAQPPSAWVTPLCPEALLLLALTPAAPGAAPEPATPTLPVSIVCHPGAAPNLATRVGQQQALALFQSAADPLAEPPLPYWLTLAGLPLPSDQPADVFDYLAALEARVLSQTRPLAAGQELEALLAFLPPTDPAARLVRDRAQFLHGLNCQLAAQTACALADYLALLRRAPHSPWSHAAAARLVIVE